jgi:homoserine dehydrogenase
MFYGPGAGSLPTASAVVGDIIDCAMHLSVRKPVDWSDSAPQLLSDSASLPFKWFVRFKDGNVPEAFSKKSPMSFPRRTAWLILRTL